MRSKTLLLLLVASVAVGVAGCDKVKRKLTGEPTGQVVATVGGEEITSLELRNELGGFSSKDPKIMKEAQDQALQQIIVRNLLAQRAKAQKLDRVPLYSLQVRRGERTLLAQMYESKMFGNVAPPTRQEAENYIANNPDKFAKRRIIVLERVVTPADRVAKEKIPTINTMEALKALLDAQATPYQETIATVDTLSADLDTAKGIEKLPPSEVFVFQEGNAYVFNHVLQTREAPFRGELAIAFATDQLRKSQALDFVRTQILGLRRAAEATITYGKGFKPDNPDFGVGPIQGAPGAPQEKGGQAGAGGAVGQAPATK
jgi:EpsD family peptidyl-prolyl cis-trans isomerase